MVKSERHLKDWNLAGICRIWPELRLNGCKAAWPPLAYACAFGAFDYYWFQLFSHFQDAMSIAKHPA
ncbi:hypothetical protein L1987_23907 [Smallanthus sonchifolius]|uniref:Uncharacterized protein n=1 Tax=Smallanthus sonchifolius TaxID=185202 RepID=A0ACB9II74_9ASTR|nr:hypothetical protein L1987_23907 [Smallanthus sonchifolius]